MVSEELIAELKELREMVNQSSEHTQRQLQNIDSNLLIGSIISFILALGISFQLKILVYWIPASFILLYLGIFYVLLSTRKTFTQKTVEEVVEVYQKIDKNKFKSAFTWAFKIISPIMTAVSLVYIVTLTALGLILNKTIAVDQPFNIFIPFISALLGVLLPFFVGIFKKLFEKDEFNEGFNMLAKMKESFKPKKWRIVIAILGLIYLIIILLIVALPVWGFSIMSSIISDYVFLIIVVVLQLIFAVISASYFSSLSAKNELINTLTNFANLDYLINDLILSKDINEDLVKKLKELYLTAKQYDVLVDDSLKFVNLYYLSMNSVYLNKNV